MVHSSVQSKCETVTDSSNGPRRSTGIVPHTKHSPRSHSRSVLCLLLLRLCLWLLLQVLLQWWWWQFTEKGKIGLRANCHLSSAATTTATGTTETPPPAAPAPTSCSDDRYHWPIIECPSALETGDLLFCHVGHAPVCASSRGGKCPSRIQPVSAATGATASSTRGPATRLLFSNNE